MTATQSRATLHDVGTPVSERRTCLYRLYSAQDQLLYVGISVNALGRLGEHLTEKPWASDVARTTIEWFETRCEAAAAEVAAIVTEGPAHNVMHNRAKMRSVAVTGWPAEAMADLCHDHCVRMGDYTAYFPITWTNGLALYRCNGGHVWTCGWGHSGSGTASLAPVTLGASFPPMPSMPSSPRA